MHIEAATLFRPNPSCPDCEDCQPFKDGLSPSGLQRYRCRACGRRFNSLTGTALEQSKMEMPTGSTS